MAEVQAMRELQGVQRGGRLQALHQQQVRKHGDHHRSRPKLAQTQALPWQYHQPYLENIVSGVYAVNLNIN